MSEIIICIEVQFGSELIGYKAEPNTLGEICHCMKVTDIAGSQTTSRKTWNGAG